MHVRVVAGHHFQVASCARMAIEIFDEPVNYQLAGLATVATIVKDRVLLEVVVNISIHALGVVIASKDRILRVVN